MVFPLRQWLRSQFSELPLPSASFAGQTVVITGSNTGLGKEAARHMLRLGVDRLIIAVRNVEAGHAAKSELERDTGRDGVCDVWHVDLASYDSILAFAGRVNRELPRVDVFLSNAAFLPHTWKLINGHESTIAVNVISTFLLAFLVLPKLRETAHQFHVRPRLSFVVSEAHLLTDFPQRRAKSIFEELDDESKNQMTDRYNVSKLMEILVVRQVAPIMALSKSGVILNMLNPGLCKSQLSRDMLGVFGAGFRLTTYLFGRHTEMGSRTLVAAASAGPDTHGTYMCDCKIGEPGAWVSGEEFEDAGQRTWSELKLILEGLSPGVTGNLV